MLNGSREYICKTCGHRFRVYADIEQGHVLQPPKACPQVCGPNMDNTMQRRGGS